MQGYALQLDDTAAEVRIFDVRLGRATAFSDIGYPRVRSSGDGAEYWEDSINRPGQVGGDGILLDEMHFYKRAELRDSNGLVSALSLATEVHLVQHCLLYTSPSPRDRTRSRMPSSA